MLGARGLNAPPPVIRQIVRIPGRDQPTTTRHDARPFDDSIFDGHLELGVQRIAGRRPDHTCVAMIQCQLCMFCSQQHQIAGRFFKPHWGWVEIKTLVGAMPVGLHHPGHERCPIEGNHPIAGATFVRKSGGNRTDCANLASVSLQTTGFAPVFICSVDPKLLRRRSTNSTWLRGGESM